MLYYEVSEAPRRFCTEKMQAKATYSGKMTYHSQTRVMRAVDMILQRNPMHRIWNPVIQKHHDYQVGFITLTMPSPQPVSAKFAHRELLQPFLRTARRKWNVEDYIWKAELQRRGQIHYHLTVAEFIDLTSLRSEWNKLLRKHRLLDSYAVRFGHFNPNSTDIHAVWKVRNLKAYLAKYIAKEEPNKARLDGKVWDCSKSLKVKPFTVMLHGHHEDLIRDAIAHGQAKEYPLERCVLFKMKNPAGVLTASEFQAYKQFLQ